MSDTVNLFYGFVFGTILSAADKMGINPMLLGRQSSKILGPMVENLAQQFLGMAPPKTMEELVKDLEIVGKNFGVFGKEFECSYSGNNLSMKIVQCPWLEMCKYGKSIGYRACPLCATSVMLMGTIEATNIVQVMGINVDNNEAVCRLTVKMEPK
ncbi:MAG: hypothetical protein QXR19_13595 [Candidatus Jordarchaeaceae archaeon]